MASESVLLLGCFVVMLLANIPIGICLGVSSILALLKMKMGLAMIAANFSASTTKFVLLAIPFFVLAGNVMEKAGISAKLVNLARTCVGHKKGGMAMVCVIVACFFAAISGSGPATVAALGMILIPAMADVGYDLPRASALMASAGAIGTIIPPSLPVVVYGSITGVSVGDLFMAGIVPGVLMGIALFIAMRFVTRNQQLKQLPKCSAKERTNAFLDAIWALLMPVIILGGIYGGIFTPTEAAAVAAVYGLFVGVFIYKNIRWKEFLQLLIDSASTTATVMFIVGCASLFSWVITVQGLAADASAALISLSAGNKIIFLACVNLVLIIAGCFLDGTSAYYIFTPIFFPVATRLGIDPVAFGVVMVVNLSIGQVTPPVGLNLYVACNQGNVTLKQISKAVIPFVLAAFLVCLLVTYIPDISLFLTRF